MRLGEEVESVEELPDGGVVANLESKKKVSGDALLYAVGRQGNVDDLNLAAAGLRPTTAAASPSTSTTRPRWSTSLRWAMWSAFRRWLRSPWSRAASPPRAPSTTRHLLQPSFYPYGIYTIPEISFIGKTEEQLTDEDVPYEVGMAYYRETARGQIRGDTTGRLKLIFHRDTRKVLGVHIIGEGASELVHIGQAVMTLGGTVDYFIDTVFNYPPSPSATRWPQFNGLGRLNRYQAG
jgi:NAD(P) transhydrogenase